MVSEKAIATPSFKDVRDIICGSLRRRKKYAVITKRHAAKLIEFVARTAWKKTLFVSVTKL